MVVGSREGLCVLELRKENEEDGAEKVDSETVDSEKVDSETVDSETVDSETVDSEKVDSSGVDVGVAVDSGVSVVDSVAALVDSVAALVDSTVEFRARRELVMKKVGKAKVLLGPVVFEKVSPVEMEEEDGAKKESEDGSAGSAGVVAKMQKPPADTVSDMVTISSTVMVTITTGRST